ncbi:hypothetical protein VP01_3282g3 [Puccinia sorghi]|uniref:RING-type domain-containing protein n=1 Tax=Puccinia sorghi TaxID=27349 RepID=A0A0L6UXN0_9BASI|nr:hypothetical protein VP01_3282g3 [Puccinia sorghi]
MSSVLSSSNPETIELFRSTYYKPKIALWFLLFILFPPIDQSKNQLTTKNQLLTNNNQLTTKNQLIKLTTTTTTTTEPIPCPDAYRDHRNNLICPHAPKRLKSVRQRVSQVLLEFKSSLNRLISSQQQQQKQKEEEQEEEEEEEQQQEEEEEEEEKQPHHYHYHDDHPKHTSSKLALLLQLILCAPLANPFLHLIIIFHILLTIQALSLLIEDALIKDACFSGPSNSFRRSSSWSKLWSRFRFRLRKQWRNLKGQQDPSHGQLSIISAAPLLRILGFLLHRPPFLKPARTLILMECLLSFISLLQPAQHILPSRILPKLVRVPDWILINLRHKKPLVSDQYSSTTNLPHQPQSRHQSLPHNRTGLFQQDHSLLTPDGSDSYSHHQQQHRKHPVVEVETKWLLAVFVEGCIGLSSIIGHLIVMSFWRQMTGLVRTSMNTIECLQLVLHEFSGPPGGVGAPRRRVGGDPGGSQKRKKKKKEEDGVEERDGEMDWTCSICFEESHPEDTSSSSSDSPSSTSSSSSDDCSSVDHTHTRYHASSRKYSIPTHDDSPDSQQDNDDGSSHDSGEGEAEEGDVEGYNKRLVNRCVLNCGHAYHTDCLVKWLHYQAFCPVCHRPVL